MNPFDVMVERATAELAGAHLLREPPVIERIRGPFVTIEGRERLAFCSNDYLGLSQDRRLAEAARAAVEEFGWGAGSSRLVAGTTTWHRDLERRAASFAGRPAALLFASGSAANMGLITGIVDEDTLLLSDELNHASVIDACRLSRAMVRVYPHGDVDAVNRLLRLKRAERKVVVTDAVFSMDGDLAPLPELKKTAERHGAELVVDDAHGFGVLGARGRGTPEHFGVEIAAHTANLAKAGGSVGGLVFGSAALIRLLTTRARSLMFTTAHPPAVAAAGVKALEILESAHDARCKVMALAARLAQGVNRLGYGVREARVPFLSVILGEPGRARAAARRLWEAGFFVPAIRPPAVPVGTSRLRISVTALHEPEHVDALVGELTKL
ncbi:MAG: 8-amino-7-oxononanoate synthase [Planctomycetes bacterium]|nr:8-amino-7-oxononanoate synthase [Planctomycetota bacterium]